jgi:hypothetical protein
LFVLGIFNNLTFDEVIHYHFNKLIGHNFFWGVKFDQDAPQKKPEVATPT